MRTASFVVALALMASACSSPTPVPPAAAAPKVMPLTTTSEEARQLVVQARDLLQNQEVAAATPLLDQAIAKDANFALAHALRAQAGGVQTDRAHLDEAVRLADKASAGERHWILAARAQADADAPGLKTHLDALIADFPDDKYAQVQMGNYQRGIMSDDKAAATYFTRATEIDPAFAAAYNSLGYVLMGSGDTVKAEEAFTRYIALLPNRPNPYDSYAEFLMKQGRFDESIASYKQALAKDPAFEASNTGIGENLIFKGDYESARATFRAQVTDAARPADKLTALFNVATTYVYEGRTADAVKAFEEVATAATTAGRLNATLNAQMNIAAVLMESGQVPGAVARLEAMAAAIDGATLPDPVKARLRIVRSQLLAQALGRQGKVAEAEVLLAGLDATITQRNNPFEVDVQAASRGLLAYDQGKHAEAATALAAVSDSDPYLMYYHALALEGAGKKVEATEMFKKVANFNSSSLYYGLVRAKAMAKAKA